MQRRLGPNPPLPFPNPSPMVEWRTPFFPPSAGPLGCRCTRSGSTHTHRWARSQQVVHSTDVRLPAPGRTATRARTLVVQQASHTAVKQTSHTCHPKRTAEDTGREQQRTSHVYACTRECAQLCVHMRGGQGSPPPMDSRARVSSHTHYAHPGYAMQGGIGSGEGGGGREGHTCGLHCVLHSLQAARGRVGPPALSAPRPTLSPAVATRLDALAGAEAPRPLLALALALALEVLGLPGTGDRMLSPRRTGVCRGG